MKSKYKKIINSLIISTSIFFSVPVLADDMPISSRDQGMIILKLLSYDRNISGKGAEVKFGVVFSQAADSLKAKKDFISALDDLSKKNEKIGNLDFSHKEINIEKTDSFNDVSVLYITPGCKKFLDKIKKLTHSSRILTVTGVPEYVETENLSVAIGLKGTKPLIIVNLPSAQAEGANFSANLLKLAKVIK